MRLNEQTPDQIKYGLIDCDNPFELAALQHEWDARVLEEQEEWDG